MIKIDDTILFSFDTDKISDYVKECESDIMSTLIERNVSKGAKILEAGAGSGKWLLYLSKLG